MKGDFLKVFIFYIQEIVVHPLNIPRSTILSPEMVNHELQACIDDLSASGEHVSVEKAEQFLLRKFRVCILFICFVIT